MTLMTFSSTFFCPPRGVMVMEQLNFPADSPTNLSFSFFTSSGLSFSFSLMTMPLPSTWKTMGVLETFLISRNSSSWWPRQRTGDWLKMSHLTLNLG